MIDFADSGQARMTSFWGGERLQNLLGPLLVIVAAVLLRLAPHEPNVAPITAMALFGGAYLSRRLAIIFPLLAMLVSDLFIGFHSTLLWVYASFVISTLLGMVLRNRITFAKVVTASLASSVIFYLVTNFGTWASTPMYTKDLAGLINSYVMAIPFFRNTLFGDLLYTGIFFGGYELAKSLGRRHILAHVKN